MSTLLDVQDLHTHFATPHGLLRAADGVSFKLDAGRALGIVGESGSGKSVLARSLLDLLPSPPAVKAGGRIVFEGQDLRSLSEAQMRRVRGRRIAMIFQDPLTSLNPVLTVGRQIVQVLRQHTGLRGRAAHERAVELLAQVGIAAPRQRVRDYPHHMSGGMRQRVVIAIALACDPKLLIADEPTTALDVTVQAQILDLLQRLQTERSMALILISHDLGVVAGTCDHIAVMYGGRIVEQGPVRSIFRKAQMRYTEALLRAIPDMQAPSHTRLSTIEGQPPVLIDPPRGCRFAPRCDHALPDCADRVPPSAGQGEHRYTCWNPVGGG